MSKPKVKLIFFILLLITLALPGVLFNAHYAPAFAAPEVPCYSQNAKKALAWTHTYKGGWVFRSLCMPHDAYYINWGLQPAPEQPPSTVHIPMMWCNRDQDWEALEQHIPVNYNGYLFFGNEPDRPDQCNLSFEETAKFYEALALARPNALLIGPCYSTLDHNGGLSWQFYQAVVARGGSVNRIYAGCTHFYQWSGPAKHVSERIADYYNNYLIPSGQGSKKIWVAETGGTSYTTTQEWANWLNYMKNDSRITAYFAFAPWWEPPSAFRPFFDWYSGQTTPWGMVYIQHQ